MIINYIISIFIIISSATGLADLFLKAQKKSHDENIQFIHKTHEKLKEFNQYGFGTLMGITLTFLFSLLFYFFVLVLKTERNELLYRKNTYLCFHSLNSSTNDYISKMAKINIALRAIAIASTTGIATEESLASKELLIKTRDLIHFSYLKKIATAPYCHVTDVKDFFKNAPYQVNSIGALSTNIDGTSILKGEKWTNKIGHTTNGIRISKQFFLVAKYSLKSNFSTNPKILIEEFNSLALLN